MRRMMKMLYLLERMRIGLNN